ncbi:alkaline phosphatase family protein [Aquipuribacter hungaricus]|uniref:Alkaline phosphatase family protein n=1 Tax=Aquipuribacter hungaricus TaxID=545624 RepID=A0ABV7WEJ7_9MICO
MSLLVLDVVGLTPKLLRHAPRLRALAEQGWQAELGTVLPAVTCSAQSTFLTGTVPTEHGIVGNGWYLRDIGEVMLWRQHNRLVQGEKVWETARRRQPGFTVANVCWWYAMGASTDLTVTPRPVYHADGRKSPDCYARPPELHDELTEALGPFPLFQYWGPTASIASTRWIVEATRMVMPRVDMTLAYLPHLDYDLQRFGPDGPEAVAAVEALDATVAPLLDDAAAAGTTVVVLSEYGITAVDEPVHVNRALREAGLLEVYVQDGRELLDPWTSRAFAVADHQVAHVYVADPADRPRVRELLAALPGVEQVLEGDALAEAGLGHERSGELVAVAAPRSWFTYYYWLDDARAPDFARGVEIHKKPGYDPAELFLDPADPTAKVRAGISLLKKKVGLRYAMSVVPLDARWVKGSHGRLPDDPDDGPVLLCSVPGGARDRYEATEVRDLLLDLAVPAGAAPAAPGPTTTPTDPRVDTLKGAR